jgi:urea transport system permease protein
MSRSGIAVRLRLPITSRFDSWHTLAVLGCAAAAAFVPSVVSPYGVTLASRFVIFGIIALSLDLLWGYGGIVSFGHAVFFGLGAYATAITLVHVHGVGGTYAGLLLALLVPVALGLLLGYFLFFAHVSGVYFGIVTLALSVILETVAIVLRSFTGGLDGLYGFSIPTVGIPYLATLEIWGTNNPFYASLIGLTICLLLARWIVRSPFGIVLRGIRDDQDRVEMLGYNTALVKTLVLAVACGMAGFAGSLYTSVGFVSPDLLNIFFSTQVLVWVGVGGRGTLWGPVIGAILVGYLENSLSGRYQDVWPLLVGAFFLLIVLFWPGGIVGLADAGLKTVRSRRRSSPGDVGQRRRRVAS